MSTLFLSYSDSESTSDSENFVQGGRDCVSDNEEDTKPFINSAKKMCFKEANSLLKEGKEYCKKKNKVYIVTNEHYGNENYSESFHKSQMNCFAPQPQTIQVGNFRPSDLPESFITPIENDSVVWNCENTGLFLQLLVERKNLFTQSFHGKKQILNDISKVMATSGYHIPCHILSKKWNTLLTTYRRVRDNKRRSGASTVSWQYYDAMDDIVGKTAALHSTDRFVSSTLFPRSSTSKITQRPSPCINASSLPPGTSLKSPSLAHNSDYGLVFPVSNPMSSCMNISSSPSTSSVLNSSNVCMSSTLPSTSPPRSGTAKKTKHHRLKAIQDYLHHQDTARKAEESSRHLQLLSVLERIATATEKIAEKLDVLGAKTKPV